ncbi:SymE family type I addiction module toxin [Pectobacterium sp. 1950-15]|uniref:SymE family type I addiction module toxin n=1 Tax=Pectobacterium sp. 1950-15 TaxID=3128982 RepID=UPI00301B39C5
MRRSSASFIRSFQYLTLTQLPQGEYQNETSKMVNLLLPPSAINLKGRWLEESSFITGMPVIVTVARGRIIIETEINL